MAIPLQTELYTSQMSETKTNEGRQLLIAQDSECVIVYLVVYAEPSKTFSVVGDLKPLVPPDGRAWLYSDFLFVLHETIKTKKDKPGQHILALWLRHNAYVSLLSDGTGNQRSSLGDAEDQDVRVRDVLLQWNDYIDPVRHIDEWECVSVGLDQQGWNDILTSDVIKIVDVTGFVTHCHSLENQDKICEICIPVQRPFVPEDPELCEDLFLHSIDPRTSSSFLEEFGCLSEALNTKKPAITQEVSSCRDVVINLFGAFNPIHTRHVAALVNGKAFLEENNKFRVLAGYISVCTDDSLKDKFKTQKGKTLTIKARHRIKMCRMAVKEYPWIEVFDKPLTFRKCAKTIFSKRKEKVRIANVFGTDRAFVRNGHGRWTVRDDEITVCVMREGQWDQVKKTYEQDLRSNVLLKRDFYFLPMVSENVSSTGIRGYLSEMKATRGKSEKEVIMRELVSKQWINPVLAEYIVKHEKKLYF